jgi:hypothetical protein
MRCEQRSTPISIVGIDLNDIVIKEGEIKMVLRCYIFFMSASNRYLLNGYSTLKMSARESFGFLLLKPKEYDRDGTDKIGCFFPAIVVFTPKPGLFSEIVPQ